MEFKEIEQLVKLMVDNKIDSLILPGHLEIIKSRHEVQKPDNKQINNQALLNEDELLFYSTSSPSLSMKDLEELAYNGSGLSSLPPRNNNKKLKKSIKE